MNNNTVKIIGASAGTGKTYRLSLEIIGIIVKNSFLLQKNELIYDKILVVTFTKKATAEIQERLLSHLKILSDCGGSKEFFELSENLTKNILNGRKISEDDVSYLRLNYRDALVNQHKLNIRTIDSFINGVFGNIISNFLYLTDYNIVNEQDDSVYEKLLFRIFEKKYDEFEDIFKKDYNIYRLKDIKNFEIILKNIIKNRWIDLVDFIPKDYGAIKTNFNNQFLTEIISESASLFGFILEQFAEFISANKQEQLLTNGVAFFINSDFQKLFSDILNSNDVKEFAILAKDKIKDLDFIEKNMSLLSDVKKNFWNGNKVFRGKAFEDLKRDVESASEKVKINLSIYYFYKVIIADEEKYINFLNTIYNFYDDLIYKSKTFSFSDILNLTTTALKNKKFGLTDADGEKVSDLFMEYLPQEIRHILIDEFQDTNVLQWNILALVVKKVIDIYDNAVIAAVGDEKQSIFEWRGGEKELLGALKNILSSYNVETRSLNDSYRSKPNIISFVNELFANVSDSINSSGLADTEWNYSPVNAAIKSPNDPGFIDLYIENFSAKSEEDAKSRFAVLENFVTDIVLPYLLPIDGNPAKMRLDKSAIIARNNKDLSEIAKILSHFNVNYLYESTMSIFNHKIVKPIVFLLKYLCYGSTLELLNFLRSDYVFIDETILKEILTHYRDNKFIDLNYFSDKYDFFSNIIDLSEISRKENSIFYLTKKIAERFNVAQIYENDLDLKNLNKFFEIALEFDSGEVDWTKSLSGFLAFIDDNIKNETYYQEGIENLNAIILTTIHKSKGLEYENTFVFNDFSSRKPLTDNIVEFYTSYDKKNYSMIEKYTITGFTSRSFASSASVLTESDARIAENGASDKYKEFKDYIYLFNQNKSKELVGEINNFYVALTRAKSNLILYNVIEKKDLTGIDNFNYKEAGYKGVLSVIYNTFRDKFAAEEKASYKLRYTAGKISSAISDDETKTTDQSRLPDYKNYLNYDIWTKNENKIYQSMDNDKINRMKNLYEKRSRLKGIAAHYYLSQIIYNDAEDKKNAQKSLYSKYGNIITKPDIDEIISRVEIFIKQNLWIFDRKWDKVFTEIELLFEGKLYRIDRLMINGNSRQIKIIDYKTGDAYFEEQITDYEKAVMYNVEEELKSFDISSEFCKIL
ncbi:MAG TPA: UvrD-helicase domain-containing protein [Spirochaetota bacterium]|nr:UvrD-helicase domain-containing protein [Spirochaetota bacterium]HOS32521.1 UvrD-helicase domain-containing protein [Spirochaetota bacterium]HOS54729.1 UvrD-helicase domain-containing protein [Spirochaetota bacterium]HPK61624.1 UvrD-helicase domain-containing protein [Spirochaetota bacterium]HQF76593.1 UvrD-helicase domain-containing protein [Spirochaetota bacterium]